MLDIYLEAQLVLSIKDILKQSEGATVLKIIKSNFEYKNPKFIENEKWGYSNYNVPKKILTYMTDEEGNIRIARGAKEKLEKILNDLDIKCNFIDRMLVLPTIRHNQSNLTLREDQEHFVQEMLKHNQGSSVCFTSFGKCHEKGTKILMFNGELKNVEDILVGEKIMGPDSKPREVISLGRGRSKMYQIVPNYGEPFTVNEDHILSLKVTNHTYRTTKDWQPGSIIDISVIDYIKLPKWKKHLTKLYKVGVSFQNKKVPFDPYFIGLWLGDGHRLEATITNNDEIEVVSYLKRFSKINNLNLIVKRKNYRCPQYKLTSKTSKNKLRQFLRNNCNLNNEKIIPQEYKINSEKNRLKLLAGLIDSDGHLIKSDNKTYEISIKKDRLMNDVVFLARSLGFRVSFKKKISKYVKNKKHINTGFNWRVHISGDTYRIPVKLKRKIASKLERRTDHLVSGFKVIEKPEDNYYGFSISGDRRYVMGDFTVTHNTLAHLELWRRIGQPGLIIVHTTFLQEQWIQEATNPKTFNYPAEKIGGIGGIFKGKRKLGDLNICLYHSLSKDDHLNFFLPKVGFVFFDEGQKSPIEDVSNTVNNFRAKFRYTSSANLKRKDGKEFITFDTFGPIRYIAEEKNGDSKILSLITLVPTGHYDEIYEDDRNFSGFITRIGRDEKRNILICRRAIKKIREGKLVLIMVERREQAAVLYLMLSKFKGDLLLGGAGGLDEDNKSIRYAKIAKVLKEYDGDTAYERISKLAKRKQIQFIIGTQKAEVGLSIRTIDHAIITTPTGNNLERFNQQKGRVERTYDEETVEYFGYKKPIPTIDVLVDENTISTNAANRIKEKYGKHVTWLKGDTSNKIILRKKEIKE